MKKTKVVKVMAPKKKAAPAKAKAKAKPETAKGKGKIIKGVPAGMTLAKAAKWAAPRISKKRFQHVTGVVEVGLKLAKLAKLSPADRLLVGLACWLHDSCKEMKDYELIEKARAAGMKLTEIEKNNGHLLHGPVAALIVRKELKISNKTVLNAI
ncbi:MAG TPA: HD domain-containing protein, partial [Candidatus Obscuribacter sp.]|nr:HD domain-containing protein [Candidatus Obscuribacter sp.]